MKTEDRASRTRPLLLEIRGVDKTYRRGPEEVRALRGVTLSLHTHELLTLVGPSGSGKSTLLSILSGWDRPDGGEIEWLDRAELALPPAERPWSDLAIVPQQLGLVEELTVRENVALPLRLLHEGAPREGRKTLSARVPGLLRALGLDALAGRLPTDISLGEQQRTAVARALVLLPRLLLLDEPTGHQDEGWVKIVLALLRVAADRGVCCLVATHNVDAVRFADRALSIRDGVVTPSS